MRKRCYHIRYLFAYQNGWAVQQSVCNSDHFMGGLEARVSSYPQKPLKHHAATRGSQCQSMILSRNANAARNQTSV
jgi:hypothetical protein